MMLGPTPHLTGLSLGQKQLAIPITREERQKPRIRPMASLDLFRGAKLVFRQFVVTSGIKRVGVAGVFFDHLIFMPTSFPITPASSRRGHRGIDVSQEQLTLTQV